MFLRCSFLIKLIEIALFISELKAIEREVTINSQINDGQKNYLCKNFWARKVRVTH